MSGDIFFPFTKMWLFTCFIFVVFINFANCDCDAIKNEAADMRNKENDMPHSTIFHDPKFWNDFIDLVQAKKAWKCNFPTEILLDNLEDDAALYKDDNILRQRRHKALPWVKNDSLWIKTMLGACKELADGQNGKFSQELQKYHMLDALRDFVEHLNLFYMVANRMESRGIRVVSLSQAASHVHDIDKLDPVMLVGYSERFEDNKTTSVWDVCVERHTRVNPHHQAHCIWNTCCTPENSPPPCEHLKATALREMICDKVSRRVQKNLNGKLDEDMWNVDIKFFEGLPQSWLDKAVDMLEALKHQNGTKVK